MKNVLILTLVLIFTFVFLSVSFAAGGDGSYNPIEYVPPPVLPTSSPIPCSSSITDPLSCEGTCPSGQYCIVLAIGGCVCKQKTEIFCTSLAAGYCPYGQSDCYKQGYLKCVQGSQGCVCSK
ncbi:MAG: hypothetical protein HY094_10585 [Candidatus Melainabacteria bacterium]|nr:hypothetical protein [Candidatus Melainabacteria bacterium]